MRRALTIAFSCLPRASEGACTPLPATRTSSRKGSPGPCRGSTGRTPACLSYGTDGSLPSRPAVVWGTRQLLNIYDHLLLLLLLLHYGILPVVPYILYVTFIVSLTIVLLP